MRTITIYLEDADGETDQPTGLHVDHGDGTSSWLASGALDGIKPSGSPKTLRQILRRLRNDAKPLPRVKPKPEEMHGPSREEIENDEAVPA